MDFYQIGTKETKGGVLEIFPDFTVGRSNDLMVRGRSFYAIWDEEKGLWSRDEYDVQRLVDEDLAQYAEKLKRNGHSCVVKYMRSFSSNAWTQFQNFLSKLSDSNQELDQKLTFANTKVSKSDYVSRRLPYPLTPGNHDAWDELIGTLYSVEERAKIEWAIGAVVSGDSKRIQKFLVLYGSAGTGKSTVLNIVQKLFEGYTTSFEAKALGSSNGTFATEAFKHNPLVAIQHDGDLSRIDDNTRLNSIVSHEEMTMNEKYKASYTARVNSFLFMGTNQPVKISDAKSGIIRRLIDVHPTGVKIPINHYHTLMSKIDLELGAIAYHCLDVYRRLGKNHFNGYRPTEMMLQTDVFFNFVEAYFDIFKSQDGTTLRQAYALYKDYCNDTGIDRQLPQYKVREELRNYFEDFKDRAIIDGATVRSYYSGFTAQPFKAQMKDTHTFSLVMDESTSIFDREYEDCAAQYCKEDGTPQQRWSSVRTRLSEIDTSQLHYVQVPQNHIVIDFDLKDENGNKSLERNLEAASTWPPTYAELSKSGSGVHLHYCYDGDVDTLSRSFANGVEIKVFNGNSSLRRRLTKCNGVPIAVIDSGLPVKEKKLLHANTIKSEKGLRELISRNLRKEIQPGTKPSIDFIHKILEDAYASGLHYDVTDMRNKILAFANNSSNQSLYCIKVVQSMKFASESTSPSVDTAEDDRITFFDVEVYPNLFVICWSFDESDDIVRMINPSPTECEELVRLKLVGYNNRRFDNHIVYARILGYSNQQLFELSQKLIVQNLRSALFGEAYNISYADIYDFISDKKSLKRFGVELGLHHMELDIPWDQPVPDDMIEKVVEYCCNDVVLTKATFHHRKQDFVARQILAELSGLSVNDTTQQHTAAIIFGRGNRRAKDAFVYTDLSKEFPGYEFDRGVSTYRGEVTGEGGYVYSDPGMYNDVALLDVASMHPTTIEQLNLFGDYTPNFSALKEARMAIKHKNYDVAREMLDGKLAPFLEKKDDADALAYALKIVINSVYGLTSARFDNAFRDPRNIDNIVAKRGALFMVDLKHAVQEKGFTVAHIKTDSIKIPDANKEIIDFVINFGAKYGYDFEHEITYEKFCLVNDAVYVAGYVDRKGAHEHGDGKWKWIAVGAQFQHPYVFKKLFTKEKITFEDMCETKQVFKGVMYLDFSGNGSLPYDTFPYNAMHHVGRIGRFVPVTERSGGARLLRCTDDDKQYAVTGTKDHLWIEAEMAKSLGDRLEIDMSYFNRLVDEARNAIDYYGSFHDFVQSRWES